MKDTIYRQAAIDAMCSACGYDCDKSEFVYDAPQNEQVILCPEHYALTVLPSTHSEIVRCKDCKWYELPSHKITENCVRWMKSNGILLPIKPDDYCSYAERRTDA